MEITLKKARLLKGLSQKQLAEMLGIHPQTYSKWEIHPDRVEVGDAKKIAKILGISYDVIFFGTDSTLSRVSGE